MNNPRICTVVFPIRDEKICLARKVRKVGVGRWNGFGGGIENGETVEDCAIRELYEECGVTAEKSSLNKVGVIDFYNGIDEKVPSYIVHFFTIRNFCLFS